jgi:hypothetical protein
MASADTDQLPVSVRLEVWQPVGDMGYDEDPAA